jgi:hypothetical protein
VAERLYSALDGAKERESHDLPFEERMVAPIVP